jgi:hypothetical protein
MKSQTPSEAIREYIPKLKALRSQFRYNEKNQTLYIKDADIGDEYEVYLDEVHDPLQIIHWALHLSQKNWMTYEMTMYFIEYACKLKGWNHYK